MLKALFTYLALASFLFACNQKNPSENQISRNKIDALSQQIILLGDSVSSYPNRFQSELDNWRNTFRSSEDSTLHAKLDFIQAKIYSWTNRDSLAKIHFKNCVSVVHKQPKPYAAILVNANYLLGIYELERGYLHASSVYLAKSVYYCNRFAHEDTLVKRLAMKCYIDYGIVNRAMFNNETALHYLKKGMKLALERKKYDQVITTLTESALVYNQLKNETLALKYLNQSLVLATEKEILDAALYNHLASFHYSHKNYAQALKYLDLEATYNTSISNTIDYYINYSGVYIGLGELDKAKPHILFLEEQHANLGEYDRQLATFNIVEYYLRTRNFEKAAHYFAKVESEQQAYYSAEKVQMTQDLITKYQLNEKENNIHLLNQEKSLIESQLRVRNYVVALAVSLFVIALALGFAFFFRQRSKRATYEAQLLQMEDRLLRSQMEPHFIFNALSSLQALIVQKRTEESSEYLAKFARLLRLGLEHSRKKYVPLADEKEALTNYLDLQQLRFSDLFEYTFTDTTNKRELILIPPLMLQPFVENAIYHGFQNIDYKGQLDISIELSEPFIKCTIRDNGTGIRKNNSTGRDVKSSLSTTITRERLAALTNARGKSEMIHISEVQPHGTSVCIFLPYLIDEP